MPNLLKEKYFKIKKYWTARIDFEVKMNIPKNKTERKRSQDS